MPFTIDENGQRLVDKYMIEHLAKDILRLKHKSNRWQSVAMHLLELLREAAPDSEQYREALNTMPHDAPEYTGND